LVFAQMGYLFERIVGLFNQKDGSSG